MTPPARDASQSLSCLSWLAEKGLPAADNQGNAVAGRSKQHFAGKLMLRSISLAYRISEQERQGDCSDCGCGCADSASPCACDCDGRSTPPIAICLTPGLMLSSTSPVSPHSRDDHLV
eukprot:CAMPEP_0170574214 /NCGR_PEP_ID=MMETSP0224-20130122/3181_1 /TAXON_ID=285029 /ORGANISM="Togula jolla, Strain CCCM 725" /LENGTH=117 /DNA_ID=CAMNT_0010896857 /DNA_START=27 /DNA_END=380 /DNA_ORIENTATION=-